MFSVVQSIGDKLWTMIQWTCYRHDSNLQVSKETSGKKNIYRKLDWLLR